MYLVFNNSYNKVIKGIGFMTCTDLKYCVLRRSFLLESLVFDSHGTADADGRTER